MTAFDYYEAIKDEYPDIPEMPLTDEALAGLIHRCRYSMRANCGELRRLSRPLALNAYIDFLSRGGIADVTCGKYIYADDTGVNPSVDSTIKKGFINKGCKYHYIPYNPSEQVAYGFIHAFIFDNKTVFIEAPHGYNYKKSEGEFIHHDGLLFEDNKEIAERLNNWTEEYNACFSLKTGWREEMEKNTRLENDPVWNDRTCRFNNASEFNNLISQSINTITVGA